MTKINNVAFIPARGGSQRLPHKNKAHIRPGISLTAWSVIQAVRMALFSTIVVSTDEDEVWDSVVQGLKHVGHLTRLRPRSQPEYLVNKDIRVMRHRRPDSLATSKANVWSAVDHWLHARTLAADSSKLRMLVMLQPTNPFRTFDTLHKVMKACTPQRPEVFTAHEPKFICDHGGVGPGIDPSQLVIPNGNMYACLLKTVNRRLERAATNYSAHRTAVLTHTVFEQIDIDTSDEFELAKAAAGHCLTTHLLIRGDTRFD